MPPALILGFTIHGLAIARALAKQGIEVYAIAEARGMPTTYTRFAKVRIDARVNSPQLIQLLTEFSERELRGQSAVVFPTSDRMVRALGEEWETLSGRYRLSWSQSRRSVLHLLDKDRLPQICETQGVAHPPSVVLGTKAGCGDVFRRLAPPLLAKPSRPQSGFKTLSIDTRVELERALDTYERDRPFVIQHRIVGGDDSLYFCAMYIIDGAEVCTFTGRKVRSEPPGMGQGTVISSEPNEQLLALARRFVRGLDLSGPVAIEFKRDEQGQFWLIEPNVGRTEYCVDLLIQSGINLPWIEYSHSMGLELPETSRAPRIATWYDTDKDILCFVRYGLLRKDRNRARGRPIFPYFGHGDFRPLLMATWRHMAKLAAALRRRLDWLAKRNSRIHRT